MKKSISGVTIVLRQGDIANQGDCEAVVNAANAQLETGGGIAGAIHTAAGPELANEARTMAPIKPGETVITKAYDLPNQYVIHCLGPVYGQDKPEDKLLANCYTNALELAEEKQISSIAFPAISTGIFEYPVEDAAKVAFTKIIESISSLKHLKNIIFVLYSEKDLNVHKRVLEQIMQGKEYLG
jgi:O-acetyl-ADP-ribose deacetylase (regulator of RNase III)